LNGQMVDEVSCMFCPEITLPSHVDYLHNTLYNERNLSGGFNESSVCSIISRRLLPTALPTRLKSLPAEPHFHFHNSRQFLSFPPRYTPTLRYRIYTHQIPCQTPRPTKPCPNLNPNQAAAASTSPPSPRNNSPPCKPAYPKNSNTSAHHTRDYVPRRRGSKTVYGVSRMAFRDGAEVRSFPSYSETARELCAAL
jgi:hypothetical protein